MFWRGVNVTRIESCLFAPKGTTTRSTPTEAHTRDIAPNTATRDETVFRQAPGSGGLGWMERRASEKKKHAAATTNRPSSAISNRPTKPWLRNDPGTCRNRRMLSHTQPRNAARVVFRLCVQASKQASEQESWCWQPSRDAKHVDREPWFTRLHPFISRSGLSSHQFCLVQRMVRLCQVVLSLPYTTQTT